jgi:hypothetical protein
VTKCDAGDQNEKERKTTTFCIRPFLKPTLLHKMQKKITVTIRRKHNLTKSFFFTAQIILTKLFFLFLFFISRRFISLYGYDDM